MGKASSAKKVARAARAGGRVSSGQPRSLLFPATLTVVAVLGVSLVVYARAERLAEDREAFPQPGDHIHAAYGVNVCGEFQGVDRKSVVEGKRVAVRVDLGGRRVFKEKTNKK